MFEVHCQGCQNPFQVDERRVPRNGMTMRCPKCQTTFLVRRPDSVSGSENLPVPKDLAGLPSPRETAALPVPRPPPPRPAAPGRGPPPPPPQAMRGGAPAPPLPPSEPPISMDLEASLPFAFLDDPMVSLAPDEVALPMPRDVTGLPSPLEPSAARPFPNVAPLGVGIPGSAFSAPLHRSTITMTGEHQPAVVARPSPQPIAPDELDLPVLADAGLPAPVSAGLPQVSAGLPAAAAGLPQISAGLPAAAAGLPAAAAGLPMTSAGLPMTSAGLPMTSAGLPMNSAGLPMNSAGLPMNSAGLPMNSAGLPMNSAGLPMQPAELPLSPAELPQMDFGSAEIPDAPLESPMTQGGGLKLGRIGIEKKAFTINADDLPVLAGEGAALPAPMQVKTGRATRKEVAREVPDVVVAMQEPPRMGAVSSFPPPAGGASFGELDLGSSGFSLPPGAGASAVTSLPEESLTGASPLMSHQTFSLPPAASSVGALPSDPPPRTPLDDSRIDAIDAAPVGGPARGFGKPIGRALETPEKPRAIPTRTLALYGGLGLLAAFIIGGAALSLTEYGPFGKNWFDDQINGPERHAAAQRVILYVDRVLEHDTYERAVGALRRLDQAVTRVPKELELKAYTAYANNMVVLRFGADPGRTGRARSLLDQLREAPPGLRYLNLAKAADALTRNNAREALRLSRQDPLMGRDLSTLAAARLNNNEEWLRQAQQARQRRPSARSRYLLADAFYATGDLVGARRMAEETLQHEPTHSGARVMLARLLGQNENDRARALEVIQDLVRDRPTLGASPRERAEACVVAGTIEMARERLGVAQQRFQRALELDPRNASALVGSGHVLLRQGNYADALARFRNAHNADEADLDAVLGLVQAFIALNQPNEAKAAVEPAVQAHPTDGRLHFWLGRALAATTDQRALAQQSFREAIRLQPENLDAYVALSELLVQLQRVDAADQVLMEARARVPDNAAIHRALAFGRISRNDLAGAEAELRTAIEREPNDLRAHFQLGDILRRRGRLDEAQQEFELVARTDAGFPGLSLARGQLAEARGQLAEALTTFREALARDPTNIELINRVAATLVALGNFGDADQMLRSVVVDHPTNAEAQYLMGRARLGVVNVEDALRYLDRSIELNPARADYNAYAAEVHRRLGDGQRALQLAERSIELDPTYPRGYWVRAEVKLSRGLATQALSDINEAVRRDPNFWEAYATWAEIDDALGRHDAAIELYRTAVRHETRYGIWFYNLGRLLADRGNTGEARSALTQARTVGNGLNPKPAWYVQATRMLADIERGSNPAEARRLYQECLRLLPTNSPAYNAARNALLDMAQQ
ncbi:MAG: tetratricopeptide repeat protein [Polyangiales bacterium]